MRTRLFEFWDRLRSSFWFVPTLMALAAIAVANLAVAVDEAVAIEDLPQLGFIFGGSVEGASAVLETVAGSMINIAGVVFSITLVVLSLASSQFGPRLLRNFIRDRGNQVVLGTFIATFLYCLIVLRTLRRDDVGDFVPHLSVTLSVLFAISSLAMLIFFIHHVTVSIQADNVIARVATELERSIDRLYPKEIGAGGHPPTERDDDAQRSWEDAYVVEAAGDGYVQIIDADAIVAVASRRDLVVRIEQRPGRYIADGSPIARVWPPDRIDPAAAKAIRAAFSLGASRTPEQDIEFAILQLVEIALRTLPPRVTEPFTAITCVDRLGSALRHLARRAPPSPYRRDDHGRLRVIAPPPTFAEIVEASFDQIRRSARSNAAVSIRLLETIATVAHAAREPEQRAALRRQADMVRRGADEGIAEPEDREVIASRHAEAIRVLAG